MWKIASSLEVPNISTAKNSSLLVLKLATQAVVAHWRDYPDFGIISLIGLALDLASLDA